MVSFFLLSASILSFEGFFFPHHHHHNSFFHSLLFFSHTCGKYFSLVFMFSHVFLWWAFLIPGNIMISSPCCFQSVACCLFACLLAWGRLYCDALSVVGCRFVCTLRESAVKFFRGDGACAVLMIRCEGCLASICRARFIKMRGWN